MQYSQMIKYIINKKAENTTLRFFVYPFSENTHNTSCNCPCPWLHPPTDNTSDRRTIGRKKHKGLSTLKLSCPHSAVFHSVSLPFKVRQYVFQAIFGTFKASPVYFHLLGCCVLYALCIGFHALQFLKHFIRKLRVYFWGGVLSLSGAVLSLLIGVVLRLWV